MQTKTAYRVLSILIAFIFIFEYTHPAHATSANVDTAIPIANGQYVNLGWFYKPPGDGTSLTYLAKNFDFFILTKNDEVERNALIKLGVKVAIPQYIRFDAIYKPSSCSAIPLNNQVAYKKGDFCNISKYHPDWFLKDKYGNRIVNDDGDFYLMDPGNANWRKYFLTRVKEMQTQFGWKGVFLDNVEASLDKRKQLDAMPVRYPTHLSYQNAIYGFLYYMYTQYFRPTGRPLLANIIEFNSVDVWYRYLSVLNGAMDECWSVDWSLRQLVAPTEWERQMEMAAKTQSMGKFAILVAQGEEWNDQRQLFAYASYLLISNKQATFRYTDTYSYDESWWYSTYSIPLGKPITNRNKYNGVWVRKYAFATVSVNPSTGLGKIARINNTDVPLQDIPSGYAINQEGFLSLSASSPLITYTGAWQTGQTSDAEASATATIDANKFSIKYTAGPNQGQMEIYVDGELVASVDQHAEESTPQTYWDLPGNLDPGPHTVKVVFYNQPGQTTSLEQIVLYQE